MDAYDKLCEMTAARNKLRDELKSMTAERDELKAERDALRTKAKASALKEAFKNDWYNGYDG